MISCPWVPSLSVKNMILFTDTESARLTPTSPSHPFHPTHHCLFIFLHVSPSAPPVEIPSDGIRYSELTAANTITCHITSFSVQLTVPPAKKFLPLLHLSVYQTSPSSTAVQPLNGVSSRRHPKTLLLLKSFSDDCLCVCIWSPLLNNKFLKCITYVCSINASASSVTCTLHV